MLQPSGVRDQCHVVRCVVEPDGGPSVGEELRHSHSNLGVFQETEHKLIRCVGLDVHPFVEGGIAGLRLSIEQQRLADSIVAGLCSKQHRPDVIELQWAARPFSKRVVTHTGHGADTQR